MRRRSPTETRVSLTLAPLIQKFPPASATLVTLVGPSPFMCARGQRTASGTIRRQMKQPQHMRQNGTMALSQQTGTCGERERGKDVGCGACHDWGGARVVGQRDASAGARCCLQVRARRAAWPRARASHQCAAARLYPRRKIFTPPRKRGRTTSCSFTTTTILGPAVERECICYLVDGLFLGAQPFFAHVEVRRDVRYER